MKTRNVNSKPEQRKVLDLEAGYRKAEAYCAKAERSERLVRDKLYHWQVLPETHNDIVRRLRQRGFLDDDRFSLAFARDKHRFSAWGSARIRRELRLHRVCTESIDYALQELFSEFNEDEQLRSLLLKKRSQLKPTDAPRKHYDQMMRYALYRGYPYDKVREYVSRLLKYDDSES